jgi:hypothetical protein
MPRRPDGRIEPGQKLASAISARAWNRAQDAADIVLGERTGFGAEGRTLKGLPQVRVTLPSRGYFGQAVRLTLQEAASQYVSPGNPPVGSLNWQYTQDEQKMRPLVERQVLQISIQTALYVPDFAFSNAPAEPLAEPEPLICADNRSLDWVISGYAVTRVRVFNYGHRHARLARTFPGATSQQDTAAVGCLDSAFFGPARIIAYAAISGENVVWNNGQTTQSPLQYPNFVLRWALVRL